MRTREVGPSIIAYGVRLGSEIAHELLLAREVRVTQPNMGWPGTGTKRTPPDAITMVARVCMYV